jgi:zinc and cadmium transporter
MSIPILGWILLAAAAGSLGAAGGAALVLLLPARIRQTLSPGLLSYATGALLAAACLGMIPAALALAPARTVTSSVLAGFVLFFVLEKIVLWRHCHADDCAVHTRAAPLILIGDAFHNFVDGAVMATAFHTALPLGTAAALAVILHEIPQEMGDLAILLESGYRRRRALALNLLSAAATLPGALTAHFYLAATRDIMVHVLALGAASFIYIAAADLIPGLHRQARPASAIRQVLLLLAGMGTVALLHAGPAPAH